jgi:SprT protein
MNIQDQAQQIRTKCQEVFVKAKQLYPYLDFTYVGIRFDLRGRAAGMACRRGQNYYMRFNADMLTREAFDHVLNDTVPHEIAHIVCFMDPRLGRNHDSGWARVCRQLGGTAERTHNEEVVYGKGRTFEYTTTHGHTVRVSETIHRKVQNGVEYRYRQGKGAINRTCAHSIVGHQGRTLAAPIVKTPTVVAPVVTAAPVQPLVITPVPRVVVSVQPGVQRTFAAGTSKAAISREIMQRGYQRGDSYEVIINAMITANGYDRQLARATFKANANKVGIPNNWGN